jgi:hypothetical protein
VCLAPAECRKLILLWRCPLIFSGAFLLVRLAAFLGWWYRIDSVPVCFFVLGEGAASVFIAGEGNARAGGFTAFYGLPTLLADSFESCL